MMNKDKDIEYELYLVETRLIELESLEPYGLSLHEQKEKKELEDRLHGLKAKMKNDFALKEIRLKKGFTRVKLSEVSKIPLITIKALENGDNDPKNAKLSTLVALARALKCKVKDFYPNEKVI